jgi:hypothetical protein
MFLFRELITTVDFTPIEIEFQQAKRIRGLCAAVARRLGLSHEHVRQVAYGNRTSKRVSKALLAEKRRRDRRCEKERAA